MDEWLADNHTFHTSELKVELMENGPVNRHTFAGVWDILSSDEDKNEFNRIVDNDEFIQALLDSESQDGFELDDRYRMFERDGLHFIALTEEDAPLWNIRSSSQSLIGALFAHAGEKKLAGSHWFQLVDTIGVERSRRTVNQLACDHLSFYHFTASSHYESLGFTMYTQLGPTRLDQVAEVLNYHGVRIDQIDQLIPTTREAIVTNRPTVIQVPIAPGSPAL